MMLHKKEYDMYDERQIRERGMIFKTAFFLLLSYNLITSLIAEFTDIPWFDYFTYSESSIIGIMLSVTICTIMMITKNAYIPTTKPYITNISVGLISICGIITLIGDIKDFNWFIFIISICTLLVCCTYWIKFFHDKRNINVDDED